MDKELLNQSYNDLSRGEKTLCITCKKYFAKNQTIITDEPTTLDTIELNGLRTDSKII